jgi:hypothetical protein
VHEGKFSYSEAEATKAWNIAVFFYRNDQSNGNDEEL